MAEYRDPPSVGGQSFTSDTTCNSVLPPYSELQVIDEGSSSSVEFEWTASQASNLAVATKCKRRGTKRKSDMRNQPYRSETQVSGQQTFFESDSMYNKVLEFTVNTPHIEAFFQTIKFILFYHKRTYT